MGQKNFLENTNTRPTFFSPTHLSYWLFLVENLSITAFFQFERCELRQI